MAQHDNTMFLLGCRDVWEADWGDPEVTRAGSGDGAYDVVTIDVWRREDAPRPEAPEGCRVISNGRATLTLSHASCGSTLVRLRVHSVQWVAVDGDGNRSRLREDVPFRAPRKRHTLHFRRQVGAFMSGYGLTVKKCAAICHTTPAVVKDVDLERLKGLAGDLKPARFSRNIAIDEFKIAKPRRYCTIVIDADDGTLLFMTRGKGKRAARAFFAWVGDEFMSHVEAVAMDMNGDYSSAFEQDWPGVAVVWDGFHVIQWFNKQVIDRIRVSEGKRLGKEAKRLEKAGEAEAAALVESERRLLFGQRWSLLANARTLAARDALNAELNAEAKERAEAEGADPSAVGNRRTDSLARRSELLDANAKLQCVLRAREELQDILRMGDPDGMGAALLAWCALYSKAGIAQLTRFTGTVGRRMAGLVARASHRISSGIMEGTNTLVKNIRRQAFGMTDFDYFALRVWEATRAPNARRRKLSGAGPKQVHKRTKKRNEKRSEVTVFTEKWRAA